MNVNMLGSALLATLLTSGAVEAQSLSQVGGPSNPPPRSFSGQQFVDSRGCLFLRAGYGNGVNWVARVDRNHKPICGMPPTGGSAAQAAVAADMAPDPQAQPQIQASAAPLVVVAVEPPKATAPAPSSPQGGGFSLAGLFGQGSNGSKPSPAPAPTIFTNAAAPVQVQSPAVVQPYRTAGVATSVAGVQCYEAAPRLERVIIAGGTQLVCTQGDGSVTGWLPPLVANARQAQIAAQTAPLAMVPQALAAPIQTTPVLISPAPIAPLQVVLPEVAPAHPPIRSHALPKPPKGWVYAWKDDRLNPLRGVGTAQGQAQQDLIWARTVPMVLVADMPQKTANAPNPAVRTSVSTMSAPVTQPVAQPVSTAAKPPADGRLIVQVGSFGEPANARGTMGKLASLGLPVSNAMVTRKGRTLQVIYAGPFASLTEAKAGLAAVHAAGFGDAFLR